MDDSVRLRAAKSSTSGGDAMQNPSTDGCVSQIATRRRESANGSGLQEHVVHHREDRDADPDAEGERQHGEDGEAGALEERPDGVAEVLDQRVHGIELPRSGVRGQGLGMRGAELLFLALRP